MVDYLRVRKVWDAFQCKNLGEFFTEIYQKLDVAHLCDITTLQKEEFYTRFRLELMEYATLPGFSWDAMLKRHL